MEQFHLGVDDEKNIKAYEENSPTHPEKGAGFIKFPHGEAYLGAFAGEFKNDLEANELRGYAKEFLYALFQQEIDNTQVFKSEKFGVSFPYTSINIAELAKRIYKQLRQVEPQLTKNKAEQDVVKKEFVFGSAVQYGDGHQFTFVEEAIHQMMKLLPGALKDLENGAESKNFEVLTMGFPVHQLGSMNKLFLNDLGRDPFGTFGAMYAEFIKTQIPLGSHNRTVVELYGTSMGAGIAALAGEDLLRDGVATQNMDDTKNVPRLSIRLDVPVSLSSSKAKGPQIKAGFLVAGSAEFLSKPYIRDTALGQYSMMRSVDAELARQGIHENVSPEQVKMKKEGLKMIIAGLSRDVVLRKETKVTVIFGTQDPTTFTPGLRSGARKHRKDFEDAMGESIIPRDKQNIRKFGAKMGHVRPATRTSELERLRNVSEVMRHLHYQA